MRRYKIKLSHLLGEGISELSLSEKRQLLNQLRSMRETLQISPIEPMALEADGSKEPEVIVSNIPRNGDIDDNNIVRLDGVVQKAIPLHPLEKQAISNYVEVQPSPAKATNPHAVRYDTTDEFGHQNNTTTIVQKMQNGSEYNFVAFQRIINAGGEDEEPKSSTGNKLKVMSTRTFIPPDQGGNVLADLLKKLDL